MDGTRGPDLARRPDFDDPWCVGNNNGVCVWFVRTAGMAPMLNQASMLSSLGAGSLGGLNMPYGGGLGGLGGARGGLESKPPAKMMRFDDSGLYLITSVLTLY